MPAIYFPYINIALDSFALIVVLIIYGTCLGERVRQKSGSAHFLILLSFVVLTLIADILGWISEGVVHLAPLTLIANTVASCAAQLAIISLLKYVKDNLYAHSKALSYTFSALMLLCAVSLAFVVGNAFLGYSFTVDEAGHYVHSQEPAMAMLTLYFPVLSFSTIILMALFSKKTPMGSRIGFVLYTLFPLSGFIVDYFVHGFSLSYIGLVVSVLIIYTHIYLQKQKVIDEQRNALMLSQINPHFMYNTLTTIAAMCDVSPKHAKALTIDFSRYLRQNLGSLTSRELIPFSQEMEHVECYLKIEKARFGERLNVIYAIGCRDFSIPPLSVQPLVENAVKHGITKKESGGTIKICTHDTPKTYVIEIIDDGRGFDTEAAVKDNGVHVGVENVRNRIASMCKGHVSVKSTIDVGTRVTIEIPKKKGGMHK